MANEEQLEKLLESLGKLTANQADVLSSLAKNNKGIISALQTVTRTAGSAQGLDASLKKLAATVKLTTDQFDALNKKMGMGATGVETFTTNIKQAQGATANFGKTLGESAQGLKKQLSDTTKNNKELSKNMGDSGDKFAELKKRLEEQGQQTTKSGSIFGKVGGLFTTVGDQISAVGGAITNTLEGIISGGSKFKISNLMTSLITPIASTFPIFGGLLAGASTALGVLIGYMEETFDAMRTLTTVGYQAGKDLGDLQKAAAATGMTLEQFKGFVMSNSQALANFGAGVSTGVDRFNRVFQPILGPLGKYNTELKRLGYTTEEMQGAIGSFIEMSVTTGEAQRLSNEQLTQSAVDTLREVDTVARLTGQTRAAIMKQLADTAKQTPAVERMMQLLGPEVAKRAGLAMAGLGDSPTLRAGFLEAITTGGKVIGPELSKIAGQMPGLTRDMMEYGRIISEGGTVSQEQIQQMMARAKVEAEQRGLSSAAISQALNLGAANGDMMSTMAALNEVFKHSIKDTNDLRKGMGASGQAMVTFEQLMAEISRIFRSIFLPTLETGLMPALKMFAGMLQDIKEKVGDFGPQIQTAAEGLATRLAMLFDEKGREQLFAEIKGYLKLLMAELIEAMSESLLGKAMGFTKTKADAMRTSGRADIAGAEAEVVRRQEEYKAGEPAKALTRERDRLAREVQQSQQEAIASGKPIDTAAIAEKQKRIDEINTELESVGKRTIRAMEAAQEKINEANAKADAAKAEAESAAGKQRQADAQDRATTVGLSGFAGMWAGAAIGAGVGGAAGLGVGAIPGAIIGGLLGMFGAGGAAAAATAPPKLADGSPNVNMPTSGGLALLHGAEAVVPLPDGRSIPVAVQNTANNSASVGGNTVNNSELLSQVTRLNDYMAKLVTINLDQQDIMDRHLRIAKDMNDPLS